MSKEEKIIRRSSSGIWLAAFLLLLAVLISLVLLASLLMDYTAGEDHMIALEPSETRGALTSFFFAPSQPEADFSVSDGKTVWQKDTQVDLFQEAYLDVNGADISVQSADDSRLIAPGTSNSYTFTLSNGGNVALAYTMTLNSTFALAGEDLPVQVRLKGQDGWILGSDTEWAEAEALNDVRVEQELAANTDMEYTLDWRWPFEATENETYAAVDEHDTELGNDSASEENTEFTLNISVTAGYAPGAVQIDQGRVAWIGLVLLPLGILGWILLILWWRRFTVTCLITGRDGSTMKWKRKNSRIQETRFFFRHFFFGNKTYTMTDDEGKQIGKLAFKLKRKRKIEGIAFEEKDDSLVILIGKRIMAVELYLNEAAGTITVDQTRWAAIDRKHNVYSPEGRKKPDQNKRNCTASGLMVEKNGKLDTKKSAENA